MKSKRPKNVKSYGGNAVQRRTGSKRQQKVLKNAQAANTKVEVDKLSTSDILDVIDRSLEIDPVEQGVLVDLDDDQVSVASSIRSGPSVPHELSATKTLTLCPVCRKLYQRARKMKAPLKDKLLDINPKSLTCDRWILLKPWHSKTTTNSRGKPMSLSKLSYKLRAVKKSRGELELTERKVCSRPHLFLQRNLKQCIRNPMKKEKKKNRRKRAREDCQGPRAAKQRRLVTEQLSNNFCHNDHIEPVKNSFDLYSRGPMSSTSSLESGEDSDLTSMSVTSETDTFNTCPKQSVSKRGAGFKDLLAQLRGNSSMIIRESATEVTPKKHPSFTGWKRS